MVCNRCIMVVRQELENLEINFLQVRMGEVELHKPLTGTKKNQLADRLTRLGFELLDSQKQQLIEKIKTLLIQHVQQANAAEHFSISGYLGKAIHKDYSYLSKLFSEVEGITIEQFFILQKIEKTKELIIYDELSLSEIAWKLGYSSVAHLSTQFKKITGLTPGSFKKIGGHRNSLDEV